MLVMEGSFHVTEAKCLSRSEGVCDMNRIFGPSQAARMCELTPPLSYRKIPP